MCPSGKEWDDAVKYWKSLKTDAGAKFDIDVKNNYNMKSNFF